MREKQKGMTLVELIIGLGLMSMVLTVLYMIFFTGLRSFEHQMENANNQTTARQTLSYIGREIRRAEDVVINNNKSLTVTYGGSDITYEFKAFNETIFRVKNGVNNPMIEGVKDFNIEIEDDVYNMDITCVSERYDNPIEISTQIRIRE